MKKAVLFLFILLSVPSFAQLVEYDTRAYLIVDLDPILDAGEGTHSLVITPQIVTYYDCDGNIEKSHTQYEISYYNKVMGMVTTTCKQTISGKTLCLLKVMAQKTLNSIQNGGIEGFVIDNGIPGNGHFELSVSECKPPLMRKGWYMNIYTGVYNQYTQGYVTLSRNITQEFVKALSQIQAE